MSRHARRDAARAVRQRPVERTPRKRATLAFITGVLVGLALPIALLLTGCSATEGHGEPVVSSSASSRLHEAIIELTDGRTVTCVVYSSPSKAGLSCDWGGVR